MRLIGLDEAGYGPKLGPLVITATVWEVPDRSTDLWKVFADVVQQTRPSSNEKIHVADSKQVYQPARGLAELERSVLCTLSLLGPPPDSFERLWQQLCGSPLPAELPPWYRLAPERLPTCVPAEAVASVAERWQKRCRETDVRLVRVRSDVVWAARFNRLVDELGNKSWLLSRLTFQLLRNVWSPQADEPTLVLADKHGSRNSYQRLLAEFVESEFPFCVEESLEVSHYRIGATELRLEAKGERHFPVAVASLVSKYVRELVVAGFNRFWQEHQPDLKPTKGYPQDAQRFQRDIAAVQAKLGIPDEVLVRKR